MDRILKHVRKHLSYNPGIEYLIGTYNKELRQLAEISDAGWRVRQYESLIHLRKIIFIETLQSIYEITGLDFGFNRSLVDQCLDRLGFTLPDGINAKDVEMINAFNYMKGLPLTS